MALLTALIIDDSKTFLAVHSKMLVKLGYDITSAENGKESLGLQKGVLDLVLCLILCLTACAGPVTVSYTVRGSCVREGAARGKPAGRGCEYFAPLRGDTHAWV